MSHSLSTFIKSTLCFEEFISNLEKEINTTIDIIPDDAFPRARFHIFGFSADITGDLDYEDDMGIDFSSYDYVIIMGLYSPEYSQAAFNLQESMMIFIAQTLWSKMRCPCIVVEEGYKIIAEHKP
jgi:hypothetical protein